MGHHARQKVYLAVNVLGYSRGLDVVGMPRCDAEHTYEALIRAFEDFLGVPASVLVDNQKAAVLAGVMAGRGSIRGSRRWHANAGPAEGVPAVAGPDQERWLSLPRIQ